jgi:nondiscriminating glutamyl-tRNA synthetase
LHVGGARTALFNWLFARKNGGKFILRVEDTDEVRSTDESMHLQLQDLKWLGLNWDEGPDVGGEFGPYRQRERKDIYKKVADELFEKGRAYYCFCSDELLQEKREAALKAGRPPHYDRTCLNNVTKEQAEERIKNGEQAVVRFRTDSDPISIHDLVRGNVEFGSEMVGDFVLLRSGGLPVYNFCCAVDDHMMKISHVLRGDDHLSNTARQEMVYKAMGWDSPVYAHVSMILGEDRQKLSKRHGATSVGNFQELGVLPEALRNFLALLGWNPGDDREVMSMDELLDAFSADRFNPSPAVFDFKKLSWMNGEYLKQKSFPEFKELVLPYFEKDGFNLSEIEEGKLDAVLEATRGGVHSLEEVPEAATIFFDKYFKLDEKAEEVTSWEEFPAVLDALRVVIEGQSEITADNLGDIQNQVKEKSGAKGKKLFMPIRVITTGRTAGPELKISLPIIGKESVLKRIDLVKETHML